MSEWQPIETAPKDNCNVLICDEDDFEWPVVAFWDKVTGQWLVAWDHEIYPDPTYWAPLPTKKGPSLDRP